VSIILEALTASIRNKIYSGDQPHQSRATVLHFGDCMSSSSRNNVVRIGCSYVTRRSELTPPEILTTGTIAILY